MDRVIEWRGSQAIGPDEAVHYLVIDGRDYALLFEDHGGKGYDDDFVKDQVLERHVRYEIIPPHSASSDRLTYDGFQPSVPYVYCHNITGTFTLFRLTSLF